METARRTPFIVLILLLILLLAAGLRLWRIDSLPPGFHFDESYEGLEAWRILTEPAYKPIFLTGNFGVAPLNSYANALVFGLFELFGGQAGPTAMRTTAAIFGVLAVVAVFALGDEMRRGGRGLTAAYPLLAAAVLAVMRWHIHFSRIGIEPIIVPLVWATATWLLLRGWRTGSWWSFAGCGAATAASMYTYQGAWVIPFVMAANAMVLLITVRSRAVPPSPGSAAPAPAVRRRTYGLILAAVIAAVLVAPLAWFLLRHPDLLLLRPGQIAVTGQEAASAGFWQNAWATIRMFWPFGATGDLDPRRNLPGAPVLSVWLAVPFFAGVGMALWRSLHGQPAQAVLLIGLVGLLLPGALSDNAPHFHRVLGAAAPVALLAALPLDWLWRRALEGRSSGRQEQGAEKTISPLLPVLLVAGLLLAAAVASARDYFVRWAPLPDLYYAFDQGLWDLGRWIAGQPAGTPVYLTPRSAEHPTLAFAWREANSSRPVASFDGRRILPFAAAAVPAADKYAVIEHEDFRTRLLLPGILPEAATEREFVDTAGQVYARVYTRPAGSDAVAQPVHALNLDLGDGIRLVGYDAIPETPQAGAGMFLRLYWEVTAPPSADWTVFTHVLGPPKADGSVLWAGYDSQPGLGSLPTSHWQPGWQIIDEYPLELPANLPPGAHTLEVGLYQASGERLPATGTGLAIGSIQVAAQETP